MRIVLWILLLFGLCAAVTVYHDRVLDKARAERAQRRDTPPESGVLERGDGIEAPREVDPERDDGRPNSDLPPGWDRAIVGAKSGVQPIEAPAIDPHASLPAQAEHGRATGGNATNPRTPNDAADIEAEHVVLRGESLSTICQAHYGTARADLVTALARWNKLERADEIREGQKLTLPPLAKLSPPR